MTQQVAVKLRAVPELSSPVSPAAVAWPAVDIETDTVRAVLGSVLVGTDFSQLSSIVAADDIAGKEERFVFDLMSQMHDRRIPISPVSVSAFAASSGQVMPGVNRNKLASYLASLVNVTPAGAMCPWLALQVVEHSVRRRAVFAAERIETAAASDTLDGYRSVVSDELGGLLARLDRLIAAGMVSA